MIWGEKILNQKEFVNDLKVAEQIDLEKAKQLTVTDMKIIEGVNNWKNCDVLEIDNKTYTIFAQNK